jgi:hypothetical protein
LGILIHIVPSPGYRGDFGLFIACSRLARSGAEGSEILRRDQTKARSRRKRDELTRQNRKNENAVTRTALNTGIKPIYL